MLAERLAGAARAAPVVGTSTSRLGWPRRRAANNVDRRGRVLHRHLRHPAQGQRLGARSPLDRREDLATALAGRQRLARPAGRHCDRAGLPEPARRPRGRRHGHRPQGCRRLRGRRHRHQPFRVNTRATAVAGYLQSYCDSSRGPVTARSCPSPSPVTPSPVTEANTSSPRLQSVDREHRPPCHCARRTRATSAGSTATPPGGGAGELVCSIVNPDNPSITLPTWHERPVHRQRQRRWRLRRRRDGHQLQRCRGGDAKYNGQVILIPQFDLTCRVRITIPIRTATKPAVVTAPNYGCPNAPGGGSGQNIWYRMPSFAFFELCSLAGRL